jgi:hypothetical protein
MQTSKIYKVINTHDFKSENKVVHEYTITVNITEKGQVITLYRSFDDCWEQSHRGEEIFTIIDTGDGLIYPKKLFVGDVDYALHAELFIILSFLNKTEHMPLYKGDIEEVTPQQSFEI